MTKDDLDQLAITRSVHLSIDAVQQAKSGIRARPWHWRPWSIRSWNRVHALRPKDPIWPDRDRFVLSNGPCIVLLWSVLHLTGTQAVNADYERLGKPSVTLDDIRHFRQLEEQGPRASGIPLGLGVETTTARWARDRTSVGHGDRPEMARQPLQSARIRDLRLRYLRRVLRRRLPDGRRRLGGGLSGRTSRSRRPVWIYDNNHITIEGNTRIAFTEDVASPLPGLSLERGCGSAMPMTSGGSRMRWQRSGRPRASRP